MRIVIGTLLLTATIGCAPTHLRPVGLSGGGREAWELFRGGWDAKEGLIAFDESRVKIGVTRRSELVRLVGALSSSAYAAVYVERAKLEATATVHALFCDAPMCLVVFDRKDGSDYPSWGEALAVFELPGSDDAPIGKVWLAARAVRPPGPRAWPLMCRSNDDAPRHVHPEGGALYPARTDGSEGFALFGTPDAATYQQPAPGPRSCDEHRARETAEPEPERPRLKVPGIILGN